MLKKFNPAILTSFIFLAAVSIFAQKEKTEPIKLSTNLMVQDKDFSYVSGLKAEGLKLFEDGVEQKIESIVAKPANKRVLILVDNSGSVRSKIEYFINATKTLIINLEPEDEAMVIRFVGRDKIEIVQEWTSSRAKLFSAADNLYIDGGHSVVVDALYLALGKIAEGISEAPDKRYAIVMISDGDDRSSYYTRKQLFDLIDNNNPQIFSLAWTENLSNSRNPNTGLKDGKTRAETLVQELAMRTGGTAQSLSKDFNQVELLDKLKSIIIGMRSQYVITYSSTNGSRNGLTRKLKVEPKTIDPTKPLTFTTSDVTVPINKTFK
mgnify:CR=1 FL=1